MKIQQIKPDIKVLMMTAYSFEELLQRARDQGALGILHKPVSSEELLGALIDATRAGFILLVDDDPDFTAGIEMALTEAGYTVTIARNRQYAEFWMNFKGALTPEAGATAASTQFYGYHSSSSSQ